MENQEFVYLVHDSSNSNPKSRNYCWWFETEQLALDFLKFHKETYPKGARLEGPYCMMNLGMDVIY